MLHFKHCKQVFKKIDKNFLKCYSTSKLNVGNAIENASHEGELKENLSQTKENSLKNEEGKMSKSKLVSAAFASLTTEEIPKYSSTKISEESVENSIKSANTINELLQITEYKYFTKTHALMVVSTLAAWSSAGKVNFTDFEKDSRFQKLCDLLGTSVDTKKQFTKRRSFNSLGDDLTTVLSITGDEEAAKLISSISLSQMVKILKVLSQKKRRSTPLLRSLSYNITKSKENLNLKECADVLYSCASLNFPDMPILEKVCQDLLNTQVLEKNPDKSAVVASILISFGILRYKNLDILNLLSDWIITNNENCRTQDLVAYFQTLAALNYQPINWNENFSDLVNKLDINDMLKPSSWIDYVWSLLVLNCASSEHVSKALNPEYIDKLQRTNSLTIPLKIKLLNINACATLQQNFLGEYNGPLLADTSEVYAVTITSSKERQKLVKSIIDALNNLLPSTNFLKTNVDIGMGFVIDAECILDKKYNPIQFSNVEKIKDHGIKISFLALDYHDVTFGKNIEINGVNSLIKQILEAKGYRVILVPYTEFNATDKLVKRVRYLETNLKEVVKDYK